MSDGWHDDPMGRYAKRYFDGTSWTHYVSDGSGATQQDPLGIEPNPTGHHASATTTEVAPPTVAPSAGGFRALPGNPLLRFIARVIDGIIVGVPVGLVLGSLFDVGMNFDDPDGFEISGGPYLISVLVFAAYEIYMVGKYGRTVGKMVCGLTVVRRHDVSLPGYGVAAVRYVAWLIYIIPFVIFISIIMAFSGSLRQTIHDKVAGTVVAKTSSL